MVNKITPWFIHIFIEPSRSLHYKFQHSLLNRDENWDITNLPAGKPVKPAGKPVGTGCMGVFEFI